MSRIAVTLTTINMPTLLEDFVALMKRYGTGDAKVDYIVVGDLKTPAGVDDFVKGLNGRSDSVFTFLDVAEQERRFSKFSKLWNHIPVNSFARRNYGDLLAYHEGYDAVIRIDDDNFPTESDFFGGHCVIGKTVEAQAVSDDSGWYNICETLEEREGIPFYPRGYPYSSRWVGHKVTAKNARRRVVVNAGLWLGDPDVDAITRLCKQVEAVQIEKGKWGKTFLLEKGTWCPINTQNTAFHRDTIPAAFVSPHAGRYDDIISGFFLRHIIDHMGDAVAYGVPLLNQIRNAHNLWKDLEKETPGATTATEVTGQLREMKLSASSYAASFGELVSRLRSTVKARPDFYGPIFDGMEIWAEMFR